MYHIYHKYTASPLTEKSLKHMLSTYPLPVLCVGGSIDFLTCRRPSKLTYSRITHLKAVFLVGSLITVIWLNIQSQEIYIMESNPTSI